jgi:transcriptional regulator of acetoin/glycerol metabolism
VNQWTVAPSEQWSILRDGHDAIVGERADAAGIRDLVAASWRRSLALELNPDGVLAATDLADDELRDYRDAHPLSLALPTIHRLLIRHTFDAGLIVAVGDQAGRLLWIDGDRALRRKAEHMMFVEGADWSEARVGTSAPGTALALDHGIQIAGPEHFTRIVHPWSCTAVPVHDPETGSVIGVIDVTGGDDAVAPATLPLMEAAVAAVEAELRIQRLDGFSTAPRRVHHAVALPAPVLSVLGTDTGRLETGGRVVELSERHAEILVLLASHPDGLSAEQLAGLLYEREDSLVTLRAEMVRLRRELESIDASLVPLSRPYRLPRRLELDAHRVLGFLDRGAHKVALAGYAGAVLPGSVAPGIVALRGDVSERLRDALLTDASVETLLAYARTDEAAYDVEVWRACLRLLPPKSPKRAAVVRRLERIETELRN